MLALLFAVALAQSNDVVLPRATPQEVLLLEDATPCDSLEDGTAPRLLRTTVGMFAHDGSGSYAYVCPTKAGGDPLTDQVVVSPSGDQIWTVADGSLFLSTDSGCSAAQVPLAEGLMAKQVLWFRGELYVLAVPEDLTIDAGALLRYNEGSFIQTTEWTAGFRPHAMGAGGPNTLWITALEPATALERFVFAGGLTRSGPIVPLPADSEGASDFRVAGGTELGGQSEAWFVLERGSRAWTWHARAIDGDTNIVYEVTQPELEGRTIFGPIARQGAWLGVIDNQLVRAAALAPTWNPTGQQVGWTCLDQVGDNTYVCTVPSVELLTGFRPNGKPETVPVFDMVQVTAPPAACSDPTCDAWFQTLATDAGLDPTADPAACPDGTTLAELEGASCECGQGGVHPGWLALLAVAWRRRRHG